MKFVPYAAAAATAVLLLTACEQRQQTTRVEPLPPAQSSSASASTSPTDPSVPPADVASGAKTAQDGSTLQYDTKHANPNPSAATGNDGSTHSALTADERDRQMPMKGQVNDYNTPDRAKEGDQPNTASKEPGGQEAKPGNQSSAADTTGSH